MIPDLELGLGLWQGAYQGIERNQLRWCDLEGRWIPISAEQAEQERQARELAQQQAEQERQRADRLAARLRELGIDLEEL